MLKTTAVRDAVRAPCSWRDGMRRIALALCALLLAGPVQAAPWAEVGDGLLRQDVELLKDAGYISGPTMSWPIAWAQIGGSIDTVDPSTLPPLLRGALLRVKSRMADQTENRIRLSANLRATSEPALVRGFDETARADVDVSARAEYMDDRFYLSVGGGWRDLDGQRTPHLDQTYGMVRLGNWALVGGYFDQYWGPSAEGGIMLSNNARPFPKVGFKRLSPDPFETRWLSWLGPWSVEGFVGVQDDPRSDPFANPVVAFFRLSVEPFRYFELGLSRSIQTCGKGRPCGFKNWAKALVPVGGADNTGSFTEPGNQQVGYDFRYARPVPWGNLALFLNVMAEDGVGEAWAYQAGFATTSYINGVGTLRLGLEHADTWAYYTRFFNSLDEPGRQDATTYLHFIYRDGMSYRGRSLGHSLDGDSQMWSLTSALVDTSNRRWKAAVRRIDLNITGTPRYRVSRNREKLWLGEASVHWPSRWGDISVSTRYMTDRPNTPGRRAGQAQVEVGWKTSF
jgi:hypothetical protein